MKTKLEAENRTLQDDDFGCPKCGHWDDYLPLGSEDWQVCYRHRTKFLCSAEGGTWGDPEHIQLRNAAILEHFTEVEPVYPAIPANLAAGLLRLADAVSGETGHSQETEDDDKQTLAADADLVRRWVQANRTKWVQYIHLDEGENPRAREAGRV